jgi:hypothetical protein
MAVVNVTPDSFSDAGLHARHSDAVLHAHALLEAGADILDIGGESTRPGSDPVPEAEERARVLPLIAALRAAGVTTPISIDTRKPAVARAALEAGADMWNDVSALGFDRASPASAAATGAPVCLMHAQGDPKTMQDAPRYDDVLLDVFDFLAARIIRPRRPACRAAAPRRPRHRLRQDGRPQPRAGARPRDPARPRLRDPVRRLAQALHRHGRGRAGSRRPRAGINHRRARGFAAGRAGDTGA